MSIREKLVQRYPYELNPDAEQGFADAVHNNQVTLAMYYMIELVASMQEEIAELKKTQAAPVAKKATAKKTTKKTATAASSEAEDSE